ncbi:MAG: glutathione S-transferase family protein [Vannielia sp.]|nr:glutathione S-transferase family protein [Vannielia sp.]MDF1872749.1 glutathione S-transferase family protein [Vannielia sp.]
MLQIWGRKSSSNVQALMWCVGELGLVYERHDAGHIYGITDTDEFAQMNPNRTVPVLSDGEETPLWETGAILRYLANVYGRGPFWPEHPKQRAQVDKWAEWSKINIALCFTGPVFWRVVRTPKPQQDPSAIADAVQNLEAKLLIAERQLQNNEWLCGADFTLADIQFGHVLYRYFDIEIQRRDFPSLKRYFETLMARDAYCEHVAISYEELRASLPT